MPDHIAAVREALEACQSLELPLDIGMATDKARAALAAIEKDQRRATSILREEMRKYAGRDVVVSTGIQAALAVVLARIEGGDDVQSE